MTKQNTIETKRVKAWAVIHEPSRQIVDVGFIDAGDFKPTLDMFVSQEGVPTWAPNGYKLIECVITHVLPLRKN